MKLNEIDFGAGLPIDGYGPGFFRIAGEVHRGAVLVSAGGIAAWGGLEDEPALLGLADTVDVLFVGMGAAIARLPKPLRERLEEAGIGVEAMDTPAACRTYNVLLSEGRRVAVALLPV